MKYKILLFDLDDTLLDFGANEAESLKKLFQQNGYELTDELFKIYSSVNNSLWADYENGKITLDDVLFSRFSKTMQKLGIAVDGVEWDNMYREHLSNGFKLMDGALEMCRSLYRTHRLFVITNGITETQLKRIKKSGLSVYFEDIFDSQSIGFQKPSFEFFDYVKTHIKNFNSMDALIIGDSLNTDIKGGIISGIDTCWINNKNKVCPAGIKSTYTISNLFELLNILK